MRKGFMEKLCLKLFTLTGRNLFNNHFFLNRKKSEWQLMNNTKNGKVVEWASAGGAVSRPYAIAATSDGMIWFNESGVEPNTLVVFDPRKTSFQKWEIPSGGGVARHIVVTPDGKLYLTDSGVNKVAVPEIRRK